jgi:hypothetical protein
MRTTLKLAAVLAFVATSVSLPSARQAAPAMASIGPIVFGENGILFAADRQSAAIFALDLSGLPQGQPAGTKEVANIDRRIAEVLGTSADALSITDIAVHPATKHTYLSVMRGQGPDAQPALFRVDGAGALTNVDLRSDAIRKTSVALPNPTASRAGRNVPVTDMAFVDGRLLVSGMSNEEFASKLWSIAYPFAAADQGASVEIYHANHDAVETRAPIMAFAPVAIAGQPHVVAGYTCTPLVTFAMSALKAGDKVRGKTIGEFGAGNQPIDLVKYSKGGQDYLLMTNSRHGVMKIATASFAGAAGLTARVGGTAGVPFERIAAMPGFIEQLDLLDGTHSVVISRSAEGARTLTAVVLP